MTHSTVVAVLADEQLRQAGIVAMLDGLPGVSAHRFNSDRRSDVVIADLTELTRATMRPLIVSHRAHGSAVVVITDGSAEADLSALSAAGAVTIMHTAEATPDRMLAAIQHAIRRDPPASSRASADLSGQLRSVRRVRTGTQTCPGLSERETAVLRYLSEGLDTVQIMKAMDISERTLKYILWGVMRRHSLRNRVHAVAFAIRAGVL
jgi:DNA-binding NarL/FixJ family response regulator